MSRLHLRTSIFPTLVLGLGVFGQGCIIQGGPIPSENTTGTASSSVEQDASSIGTSGASSAEGPEGSGGSSDTTNSNSADTSSQPETSSDASASSSASSSSSDGSDATGTGSMPAPEDPYLWLEEVESKKSMDWVKEQNQRTAKTIESEAAFGVARDKIKKLLDAQDSIPKIQKVGSKVYNFWKDKEHPMGIWRQTTLNDYRSKKPAWKTVLDLDQLAAQDKKNWVWKGATCLPRTSKCMLALSDGGKDAVVYREFDAEQAKFIEDGFRLPESVGQVAWMDKDTLMVGTNFGDGTTTQSGYPKQIRKWIRGTQVKDAPVLYEGEESDSVVRGYHIDSKGVQRNYLLRYISRHHQEHFLLQADDTPLKLDVPKNCRLYFWGEWLILELKEDWDVGGKVWPQGSVIAVDHDDFVAGKREISALFTPSKGRSFQRIAMTRNHVLLVEMQDVKGRLREWSHLPVIGWRGRDVKVPESGSFTVDAYDVNESNFYAMTYSDFLTPSTLYWARSGTDLRETLYSLPEAFDASDFEVVQHFATSKDGTKVPYFQVSKKGIALDKSHPTLLHGYGGFQISLKPEYKPLVAAGWLDYGGVYVVANIRGGGEYGPAWHQAALREKRPRAYEDFVAVGEDLVARGVTQPKHLGIMGRSNGGLLTGVMLTAYPKLWGAVISEVPLLDMKRFHKLLVGALWRGEYGDPDVAEDWAYLSKFSPYQNIVKDQALPPSLFTTSTKDDRVHPAHARKMVARLQELGYDNASLYENTEGGHGGASNREERAHLTALVYAFLGKHLGLEIK